MSMLRRLWRVASSDAHPWHPIFHVLASAALLLGSLLLYDTSAFGKFVLLVLTATLALNCLRAVFLLKTSAVLRRQHGID